MRRVVLLSRRRYRRCLGTLVSRSTGMVQSCLCGRAAVRMACSELSTNVSHAAGSLLCYLSDSWFQVTQVDAFRICINEITDLL